MIGNVFFRTQRQRCPSRPGSGVARVKHAVAREMRIGQYLMGGASAQSAPSLAGWTVGRGAWLLEVSLLSRLTPAED